MTGTPRELAPIWTGPVPPRILLIKPSAIGDVVHALPVLNLLRSHWPKSHIAWLVTPPCAGLLEGHPQLDEVILFDRRRYGRAWRDPGALIELWRFTRALRQRRFDLVIDLQGLLRSGWLCGRTKAPLRVGLCGAREFAWLWHTHRVAVGSPEQHAVERYLGVAEALGCGRSPVRNVFACDDNDRQAVAAMLQGTGKFAVLLPGANWRTKRWPVERFAQLIEPLRRQFALECITAGGPGDHALGEKITGSLNLCGKTTLRQLVALLERADLVIANDSGPMHIAAALNRPLVTLFGPTNPIRTGPHGRPDSVVRRDIWCSPCYSRRCWHQSCLRTLRIDPILAAARRQIDRAAAADDPQLSRGTG